MEGFFMTEKYGFVYIWRDKKYNRYYIGCHWGVVDDGYVCSSTWMMQAYKHRPQDFRRKILKTRLTREEMYVHEQYFFDKIKPEEIKVRYYNLNLKSIKPWHLDPDKNLSIGEKISKAKKGKKVGPCTEERARKISEAKKGKAPNISEEGMRRKKEAMSKPISEEHKRSISEGLAKYYEENESRTKGKRLTEEHKKAIARGLIGVDKGEYVMTEARRAALLKCSHAATQANTGTFAINNGTEERMIKIGEQIPEGWIKGGKPRKGRNTK
jgi:hypothetical protein